MALLALLAVQADDGFDAMRHFDASVGYLWHASHTQIYAGLRKMESAGLIQGASHRLRAGPRVTGGPWRAAARPGAGRPAAVRGPVWLLDQHAPPSRWVSILLLRLAQVRDVPVGLGRSVLGWEDPAAGGGVGESNGFDRAGLGDLQYRVGGR